MFGQLIQSISEKTVYLSLLVGLTLIFILSLLPLSPTWLVIKILFFLVMLSFLVLRYQKADDPESENSEENDFTDIGSEEQDWLQIENDQDVEDLFQTFLDHMLKLVKKVLVSNTVILLFANYQKKEFTIRYRVTDHPESIVSPNTFDVFKGLPSLVLRNRTPLIENHLPEGQEIIPYYKLNQNPSHSFAAVPVYFADHIIGVLCADSEVQEAYSTEDLDILKHFGSLISMQLLGSNKLYEYESENWLAKVLSETSQKMNQVQSVEELWDFLVKGIPEIIPCDRISLSLKLNEKQGQLISIQGGTGNLRNGKIFGVNEGIVGWVMRKNQTLMVDDFSTKENYVPRFSASETMSREYFSLLCLPVAQRNKVIAVICLESYRPKNFKEQHKRILQTICNLAANMYLTTHTLDSLRLMNYKDLDTNLENINAFKFVFPREFSRSARSENKPSLIFMKPYYQVKENDSEIHRRTLKEFLSFVLPNLSGSDYIFRLFPETFAVMASHPTPAAAMSFAEKILGKVSEKKIWADGLAFDFYVNMGIVTHDFFSSRADTVIMQGEEAVKLARLQGPNTAAFYRGAVSEGAVSTEI